MGEINMNLINNIILLIILLILANYLSNGSIINVLLKYYEMLKNYIFGNDSESFSNSVYNRSLFNNSTTKNVISGIKENQYTTPSIVHDSDFKYIFESNKSMKSLQNNDDPIMKKLYYFLQSLIAIDHNFQDVNPDNYKEVNLNQVESDLIRKFLNKTLNSHDFKFTNLEILNNLTYFDNNGNKTIKPFQINADVYLNHNEIGNISLYLEMGLKYNELSYGPIKSGVPVISRIKLTNRKHVSMPLPINESDSDSDNSENSLVLNTITFTEANQGNDSSCLEE